MLKNLLISSAITICFVACDNQSEPEAMSLDLVGEWQFILPYPDSGYEQQLLDIEADSSIVINYSLYGIQPDTEPDQLNATIDYYGMLKVDQDQLNFDISTLVYRDYYFGTGPNTVANQTVFFDQCTYQIIGDTLILNYISYPADFPVSGERKFARVQ